MAKRKGRPDVTTKADIDLENPEFVKLRQLIDYTSQSVFLTGRAGTGKSTFLRYITAHTHKKFVVLAPTGIASVNVGGQTIHSFFKVPLKPLVPDDPEFAPRRLHSRMKYSKSLIKLIKALDLIVIDEISMVRADLVDFMDKILRHYSGNHREPFGGKQMLFVGDVFQLEPVITADTRAVLKDFYPEGMFFFNARAFKETAMVSIELQKVYRQKDGEFLGLLDRLRSGVAAESDLNMLNSRCVSDAETENADPKRMVMTIATRRDMVDAINEERLGKINSKAITFVGRITDDFPENSLPANKELILKEGAQVVMLKNDPSRRWVNGSIGRVVSIDTRHKTINVELADTGEVHEVEPVVWSNIRY
ncbi:MAG: AAA family ATPase, partial [Muribaculaceae bacterium]|nr:AAA family ATPase [Muribaculaceae bacterium]